MPLMIWFMNIEIAIPARLPAMHPIAPVAVPPRRKMSAACVRETPKDRIIAISALCSMTKVVSADARFSAATIMAITIIRTSTDLVLEND